MKLTAMAAILINVLSIGYSAGRVCKEVKFIGGQVLLEGNWLVRERPDWLLPGNKDGLYGSMPSFGEAGYIIYAKSHEKLKIISSDFVTSSLNRSSLYPYRLSLYYGFPRKEDVTRPIQDICVPNKIRESFCLLLRCGEHLDVAIWEKMNVESGILSDVCYRELNSDMNTIFFSTKIVSDSGRNCKPWAMSGDQILSGNIGSIFSNANLLLRFVSLPFGNLPSIFDLAQHQSDQRPVEYDQGYGESCDSDGGNCVDRSVMVVEELSDTERKRHTISGWIFLIGAPAAIVLCLLIVLWHRK